MRGRTECSRAGWRPRSASPAVMGLQGMASTTPMMLRVLRPVGLLAWVVGSWPSALALSKSVSVLMENIMSQPSLTDAVTAAFAAPRPLPCFPLPMLPADKASLHVPPPPPPLPSPPPSCPPVTHLRVGRGRHRRRLYPPERQLPGALLLQLLPDLVDVGWPLQHAQLEGLGPAGDRMALVRLRGRMEPCHTAAPVEIADN